MYSITSAIYEDMAQLLREEIGDDSYFSGVIESSFIGDDGLEVEYRLVTSLIIYPSTSSAPDGDIGYISNIVPVWVECHTIVGMEERINDFDIDELKIYLCQ